VPARYEAKLDLLSMQEGLASNSVAAATVPVMHRFSTDTWLALHEMPVRSRRMQGKLSEKAHGLRARPFTSCAVATALMPAS